MKPIHERKSRLPRYALLLAVCCEVAIIVGLYANARPMQPVKPGNARAFWNIVASVKWDDAPKKPEWSGDFLIDGDHFYYTHQHLHGSVLYETNRSDVTHLWPEVRKRLAGRSRRSARVDLAAEEYAKWKTEKGNDIDAFLDGLQDRRIKKRDSLMRYLAVEQYLFQRRVDKARRYAANLVFEFLWFSMLVWLIFRPLIRRTGRVRAFLHWQLAPLMLFLPVYLGYATWTFTSVGPSGGVLYPQLISFLTGGHRNLLDQYILESLPPVLVSISQDIGPLMVVSGRGMIGPTSLLMFGVVPGLVCAAIAHWRRTIEQKRASLWPCD